MAILPSKKQWSKRSCHGSVIKVQIIKKAMQPFFATMGAAGAWQCSGYGSQRQSPVTTTHCYNTMRKAVVNKAILVLSGLLI